MARKKAPKPKKPRKPKTVHARHPAAQLGKATPTTGGEPHRLTAAGGTAARDLEVLGSSAGLASVILDLVGEGVASLRQGLVAWQREQDRIANRAWRRPGGMARMGGL